MEDSLLHPPGQQYPRGTIIESADISPIDCEGQLSILRRLNLKPWQLAKLIQAIQEDAGLIPDEFPGHEEPEVGSQQNKRRAPDEIDELKDGVE
jgi:hypothetical protein